MKFFKAIVFVILLFCVFSTSLENNSNLSNQEGNFLYEQYLGTLESNKEGLSETINLTETVI